MKCRIAFAFLILLLPNTSLAGPHLRWNACYHDVLASAARRFTCDTNDGVESLVTSLWAPDSIPHVIGYELLLNFAAAGDHIPDWWSTRNAGTCRPTSMSYSLSRDPSWSTCADRFGGQIAGGIAAYQIRSPYQFRLLTVVGVPADESVGIGPHSGETFVFTTRLNHQRTVGTPHCAGCEVPMCIAVDYVKVMQLPGEGDHRYTAHTSDDSDWFVTWQGGAGIQGDCPGAVSARNSTWGEIKSLYR